MELEEICETLLEVDHPLLLVTPDGHPLQRSVLVQFDLGGGLQVRFYVDGDGRVAGAQGQVAPILAGLRVVALEDSVGVSVFGLSDAQDEQLAVDGHEVDFGADADTGKVRG